MSTGLLFVDDEREIREGYAEKLSTKGGYAVTTAEDRRSGIEAWNKDENLRIAVVDILMPEKRLAFEEAGIELIRYISQTIKDGRKPATVIAFTGQADHETLAKVASAGADGYISKSWSLARIFNTVRTAGMWAEQSSGFRALLRSLELRNPYTAGHCDRVEKLSAEIVAKLSIADGSNFNLGACLCAAKIHDIGKIAVPDDILLAPRALTIEECEILSRHSKVGADAIRVQGKDFEDVARIVLLHHRWFKDTGSGYLETRDYPCFDLDNSAAPRGDSIPLESRVVAVADAFDAMTSDRPYRFGMSVSDALGKIRDGSGTQFDPNVVRAIGKIDTNELKLIVDNGLNTKMKKLCFYYKRNRFTPAGLNAILERLRDIHVQNGSAYNRLTLEEYRRDKDSSTFIFSGPEIEMVEVHDYIKKQIENRIGYRKDENSKRSSNGKAPDTLVFSSQIPWPDDIRLIDEPRTGDTE